MSPEVALTLVFIASALALVNLHGYTKSSLPGPDRPERVVFLIGVAITTAVPVWSEAHIVPLIIAVALQGIAIGIIPPFPKHATAITAMAVGGSSITMLVAGILTGDPDWRVAAVGTGAFFLLNTGAGAISMTESAYAAQEIATNFL